jgi:hypothetical protein
MLASINSCSHAMPLIREQRPPPWAHHLHLPEAFDIVTVHKQGGTNLAVRHLVQLGHRRSCLRGAPLVGIATRRREGLNGRFAGKQPLTDNRLLKRAFRMRRLSRGVRFLALDPCPPPSAAQRPERFGVINALNDRGFACPRTYPLPHGTMFPMLRSPTPADHRHKRRALFAEKRLKMRWTDWRLTAPPRHFDVPNCSFPGNPPRRPARGTHPVMAKAASFEIIHHFVGGIPMKKVFALFLVLAMMLGLMATASAESDPVKVCIVFSGLLGDKSYNDSCYAGAQKAVEDFGVELKTLEGTERPNGKPTSSMPAKRATTWSSAPPQILRNT